MRVGDLRAPGGPRHWSHGQNSRRMRCRIKGWTRSKPTTLWDSMPIVVISACPSRSCTISKSPKCGCFRIIRRNIGHWSRMLSVRACQKGLELICDVDPAVPEMLVGDPGRLRQVITNLVGNSLKFTDNGEILVRAQALGSA